MPRKCLTQDTKQKSKILFLKIKDEHFKRKHLMFYTLKEICEDKSSISFNYNFKNNFMFPLLTVLNGPYHAKTKDFLNCFCVCVLKYE